MPIVVYLDKENDPGFDVKMKLINEVKPFQKFRVVENLEEKVMREFISWVRFVTYRGDYSYLMLAKNEAINEYTNRMKAGHNKDSDDSDDVDLSDVFKGTDLRPHSLESERIVWEKIGELAHEQLNRYPQTLEEDLELLSKDDKEGFLSYNCRNCVLFRSGEKKILRFLTQTSERMLYLSKLNQKEAKKQMNLYADFDVCQDYFKSVFLPILPESSK